MGLYTTAALDRSATLCPYEGKSYACQDRESIPDGALYTVFDEDLKLAVTGGPEFAASLINHADEPYGNVTIAVRREEIVIEVNAEDDIKAGVELLTSYGSDFRTEPWARLPPFSCISAPTISRWRSGPMGGKASGVS